MLPPPSPTRMRLRRRPAAGTVLLLAGGLLGGGLLGQGTAQAAQAAKGAARTAAAKPPAVVPLADATSIVAVVNGDVITNNDINNRARLFALSTGLPLSADVIERLKPQILQQLIDEKLRLQESQRRKIVIQDAQIAGAIKDIEQRNNMPPGTLRQKLQSDGVSYRTLIDQIRAQLAWSQVLREQLAGQAMVTPADVAEQQKLASQRTGQMEYQIGEIFIPIDDPANGADARRFAETVIGELRQGAAFPLVAAQFSQTQSALQGGQLGWVQPNQLDPAVAKVIADMPVGAISNPIRVPGGLSIVALEAKRQVGHDMGTVVTVRQAFIQFTTPLTDPQHPTEQQRQALEKVRAIAASVHGCEQMEKVAKANNAPSRPVDPGPINVAGVNPPAFRQLLTSIPIGKPTQPLISRDGIAVVTVCTRDEKNLDEVSAQDIQRKLLEERIELTSRQLMRDLHRTGAIDIRLRRDSSS